MHYFHRDVASVQSFPSSALQQYNSFMQCIEYIYVHNCAPLSMNKDILMTVDIFGFDLAMESADLCSLSKL